MWHTIKLDLKKDNVSYHCHITQKLSKYNVGHYRGFITDEDGHCIAVIESTNSPKDPLRLEEATEICSHAIPDDDVKHLHPQTILEHNLKNCPFCSRLNAIKGICEATDPAEENSNVLSRVITKIYHECCHAIPDDDVKHLHPQTILEHNKPE